MLKGIGAADGTCTRTGPRDQRFAHQLPRLERLLNFRHYRTIPLGWMVRLIGLEPTTPWVRTRVLYPFELQAHWGRENNKGVFTRLEPRKNALVYGWASN